MNAQFLYSSTICMLQYDPQHASSSTLLILRRTNLFLRNVRRKIPHIECKKQRHHKLKFYSTN